MNAVGVHHVDERAHAMRWLDADERKARAVFDREMTRIARARAELAAVDFGADGWRVS